MPKQKQQMNLALQGGGAHGAFTWGVLDALLENNSLDIEGITGTSAGAINGALLAYGFAKNGANGARETLKEFWHRVAQNGIFSPVQRNVWEKFTGNWSLNNNPTFAFWNMLSHMASPYDLNPLNLNPLQSILEDLIDFELLRNDTQHKLFIAATNVHTGKIRVFEHHEITVQTLLASACLPQIYQAVEIEGTPYWDGGYMGNPALYPLFYKASCQDVLLVSINPIERKETPKTARDIQNRLNEISFNATLLRELRAIDFVSKLVDEGKLSTEHYKAMRIHQIEADEEMRTLSTTSKMNVELEFLQYLFELGRTKAQNWLALNLSLVGKQSSVKIRDIYE